MLLGCAKAAPVGRGHEHPHGKKKRLRSGHDVGEAAIVTDQQFPRHCRMFMAHLHRWALAFLGFWVRRLLGQRGGIGTASASQPAKRNRVAPRPNCAARQGALPPGRSARAILAPEARSLRAQVPDGLVELVIWITVPDRHCATVAR